MYKLVIKDNCKICESSEAKLRDAGLLDQVSIVHISTDEGLSLAKEHKLKMAGSDIIDTENSAKMSVDEFIATHQ